ncbi:MAG: ribosomal protein [Candidatus Saccharibacteria bacterium]|nr:ribosomal protein [Candidatus Saccharibacteria bacterium]
MAIKQYNPVTPSLRGMTTQDFDGITSKKPLKSLTLIKKGPVGRNNQGRITTRHRGGGAKRYYRLLNFKMAGELSGVIEQIEYDPNRSARIARVKDTQDNYHYILAAKGMKPGNKFSVGEEVAIEVGNRLPLKSIPTGTQIHAIELQPGRGAQMVRSAGGSAQLIAKDENSAQVRLPSGEVRMVHINCMATIGVIGNEQHQNVKIGKAGRKRHMGFRPTVRGIAMNAADHPMGGGDGGAHGLGRNPKSPWGQPTLGYKTRSRRKPSKHIIRTRHQGKRR